jgi:hypothetical protein
LMIYFPLAKTPNNGTPTSLRHALWEVGGSVGVTG